MSNFAEMFADTYAQTNYSTSPTSRSLESQNALRAKLCQHRNEAQFLKKQRVVKRSEKIDENNFLFFNKLANRILISPFSMTIDRSGKSDEHDRKETSGFFFFGHHIFVLADFVQVVTLSSLSRVSVFFIPSLAN